MAEDAKLVASDQDVTAQIASLTEKIQELHSQVREGDKAKSEADERIDRLSSALMETNKLLATRVNARSEYPVDDALNERADREIFKHGGRGKAVLDAMLQKTPTNDKEREFHEACDNMLILWKAMETASGGEKINPRSLQYYRENFLNNSVVKEIDTGIVGNSGTPGLDGWYPIEFSSSMHEQVRLARVVASIHPRVPMPTNPFKMPIEGNDAVVYTVPEAASDASYVTANDMVKATSPANLTNLTLTAKKTGARLVVNAEAMEASVIPLLGYMRDKLVDAQNIADEDGALNGDLFAGPGGSTAIDADTEAGPADAARAGWDGLRKFAVQAFASGTGPNNEANTPSALDIADLRKCRLEMGVYAIMPGDVVFITGPVGYSKLLSLHDAEHGAPSPILTIDKYGDRATILSGELARVDGVPIIVSQFYREDLNNEGVADGVTTSVFTSILCVNRQQFIWGDFRGMSLNSRYVPDSDQNVLVTLRRLTFHSWFPTAPTVGQITHIAR